MELNVDVFTGGLAQTNAYLFKTKEGYWLVDAPEGAAEYLKEKNIRLNGLILTHGHWDHIWDASRIIEESKCPCIAHPEDKPLFKDPNIMAQFGLPVTLDEVKVTRYVEEGETLEAGEWQFKIFHVPGHCPGSIALFDAEAGIVFGGDVLFAGGVGRWDLPGGDFDVLMKSIKEKILTLPGGTTVYPGHGPATTIDREKQSNPFLK